MSKKRKSRDNPPKGFMYLECPKCGKERQIFIRDYTYNFRCNACDFVMPLDQMHRADAVCTCGKKWYYTTNSRKVFIEISCVRCHSPITLERQRDGYYKTIERG